MNTDNNSVLNTRQETEFKIRIWTCKREVPGSARGFPGYRNSRNIKKILGRNKNWVDIHSVMVCVNHDLLKKLL